jgi:GT2 family glycosyltransferase
MTAVRLSVIVPATDRPDTLDRVVAAIRGATDPPDEVIAVTEPPFAGPAEARNDGAARATGDVLLFVDADVVVHADAVSRLHTAFRDDPTLAAVFGSYDDAPEAAGMVSQFRNLLHHHVHQSSPGEASTFWAGLGAVRRDAFEKVGGFDAARFPRSSVEDIDLGMRLVQAGYRIRLDPEIQATHLKRWTIGSMVETDFARRGVPWVELLLERGGDGSTLNLGLRHRASAVAAALGAAALLRRKPGQATVALGLLIALNRDFYALLARRLGPPGAAAGLGLHVLHHLAGAAAVPAGAIRYWTSSAPTSSSTTSPSSRYAASVFTDQTS